MDMEQDAKKKDTQETKNMTWNRANYENEYTDIPSINPKELLQKATPGLHSEKMVSKHEGESGTFQKSASSP